MGLANCYRKFLPGFSDMTAPLTKFMKGGNKSPLQRTPAAEQVFEWVKDALCQHSLFFTPNFKEPFFLTDRCLGHCVRGSIHPTSGRRRPGNCFCQPKTLICKKQILHDQEGVPHHKVEHGAFQILFNGAEIYFGYRPRSTQMATGHKGR